MGRLGFLYFKNAVCKNPLTYSRLRIQGTLQKRGNLGGNFGPEKKISPPPPKFPANTLPAPHPPAPTRPGRDPLLGLSIKNRLPPSRRLGLPLPRPGAENNKNIRNVDQGIHRAQQNSYKTNSLEVQILRWAKSPIVNR